MHRQSWWCWWQPRLAPTGWLNVVMNPLLLITGASNPSAAGAEQRASNRYSAIVATGAAQNRCSRIHGLAIHTTWCARMCGELAPGSATWHLACQAFGKRGKASPSCAELPDGPTVLTMLKDDQRACSSAWFAGAHFRSCTFAPSRRRCMAALRHSPPTQSFIPFATTQSQDARSPKWTADLEPSHLVDNKQE